MGLIFLVCVLVTAAVVIVLLSSTQQTFVVKNSFDITLHSSSPSVLIGDKFIPLSVGINTYDGIIYNFGGDEVTLSTTEDHRVVTMKI